MMLAALNDYYTRLQDDPDVDIAPFGFSRQQISFCVTLRDDGSFAGIDPMGQESGNRIVPQSLIVPGGAKPPGSGINPCFLWDNTGYMLGYKPDDPKPERTLQCFEAFRDRHLELEKTIDDPEFSAVCRLLESWDPQQAGENSVLTELTSGFGIFRLQTHTHFVHECEAVRRWWLQQLNAGDDQTSASGQCLVTGERLPLARLHDPKIKGVMGAQSAGAAIVSFNLDAFESYGKKQSYNSPVSEPATFQYCTALNHLLRSGSPNRMQVGETTTVFWTAQPSPAEKLFGLVLQPTAAEDDALKLELNTVLSRIAQGEYPQELGSAETPFYILGLAANASRLSVRFWYVASLAEIVRHLYEHFHDLQITPTSDRDPQFPAIWQLLRETARENKDIPPLLSGALLRSILMGTPYPQMLYAAVIRRIRADRQVAYLRAAILKAYLNRNTRYGIQPLTKELDMSLDTERPEPAYHIGRLFAELQKTQEDALPGLNDTIKDRYFSAASATPASVFPRLIRLSQHHLGKLEKKMRTYHEKRIQAICDKLDGFASHLNLQDQGLFAIGYYHQRQDMFTKKSTETVTDTTNQE